MAHKPGASAAVVVAIVMAGLPAGASTVAKATGTTTLSSASWGAIPTTTSSGTPAAGSLTLNYTMPSSGAPAAQTFFEFSSGNLGLTATTYSVVLSGTALTSTITLTLVACVGATWTSGSCAGTKTTIGSWTKATSGSSASITATVGVAARLSVQASVTNNGTSGTLSGAASTSVATLPTRQIRAATTTNK